MLDFGRPAMSGVTSGTLDFAGHFDSDAAILTAPRSLPGARYHRRAIRPFDGFSRTGAHCVGAAATALSATPTKKTTPRRLHRQHRTESRRRH